MNMMFNIDDVILNPRRGDHALNSVAILPL